MTKPQQETAIAVYEQQQPSTSPTPGELIQVALERGTDIGQLERLMDLQERWEASNARKAYVRAMAAFKANPPTILKDKHVVAGPAKYNHASLGNVVRETAAALGAHGLHAGWTTQQEGERIKVTCTITHELGHHESVTLEAPPDNSGSKNKIQQVGSTVSYLSRYTLLAILGLATEDMDDDGRASGAPRGPGQRVQQPSAPVGGGKAILKVVEWYAGAGATQPQLEAYIGKPADRWGDADISSLRRLASEIKAGTKSVADLIPEFADEPPLPDSELPDPGERID